MTSRFREQLEEALFPPVVALLIALICGDLLIMSYGQSPATVYRLLLEGTWGNAYGFGQVIYKATTLTFTGLAVSLGIRAGLFNVGAESQLAAGGFLAALVGLGLSSSFPAILAIPLCMMAAALGGGFVGAIPGVLKVKFGAHEVIVTIMLNFIVLALLNWIVAGHLHDPETLHTPAINTGEITRLDAIIQAFHGSAANLSILVALLTAAAIWFYLFRSRRGYELRAVGLQPDAAEYGGINVGATWIRAMALSGAIAGLGGINYVLGYKHYYEEGFAGGSGFLGIAVALVGRNHPVGVMLAALFFATLSQGGLAIHAFVPKQMVEVLQGVVILAVAMSVPEVRAALRKARRPARRVNPISFLTQTLRIAIPYLFAASGGVIAERAGIITLSLEGYMLTGAFSATLGAHYTGSAWIGLLSGIFGGLVFGLIHAVATIRYRANHVVSGIAINLLAIGVTRFFLKLAFDSSSNSPRVQGFGGNAAWHGFDNPLLWMGILVGPVLAFVIYRMPFGLRLRAVGEHPEAAASVGIGVTKVQYLAVAVSGMLAALGGVFLALDQHQFTDQMTAGRGFIAVAAVIFGRWDPVKAAIACLFFAAAETLQIQLQGNQLIPSQFIEMIPYLLTIIALAGVVGRAVPPAALGKTGE